MKKKSGHTRAWLSAVVGVVLLAASLVTGAAPASAADPKGWGFIGSISYGSANGSGSIDYSVEVHRTITYTDARCVGFSADYHPNGVLNTTIGASTYTSPPLSQWTATTTHQTTNNCRDASGNLITGVTGTATYTYGTWTLKYSCQLAGLAISGTLTDPDAGLTDATGFVRYDFPGYGLGAGTVPYSPGALSASCPAYPAPVVGLSATQGSPNSTLTVTGTGYTPSAAAAVTFDTTPDIAVPVGSATVGADGTFAVDITVPKDATILPHRLTVTSAGSLTRSVWLAVVPALTVSPTTGVVGSRFTATGSYYPGSWPLTISFGSMTLAKITAGADGTFTYTGTVPAVGWGYTTTLSVDSAEGYVGPVSASIGAYVPFTLLPLDQTMDAKAALWGLGTATSPATYIRDDGYYRNYLYGAIIAAPSGSLYVSHGAIRGEWGALGFENGVMGYPTGDEVGGLVNGGVYQNYDGGAILWSPATGPHESLGPIRSEWATTGFESGRLGYPTTEVVPGLVNGGSYQNYQRGAIVSSPASGTHESLGAIRGEWQATGFEHGVLRYPTTDEVGGLRNGGVYQNYQGGAVIWSPGTGAHESYGPIRTAWQSTGFEGGRLGYPTSEVYAVANGTAQNFQGGRITETNGTITIS